MVRLLALAVALAALACSTSGTAPAGQKARREPASPTSVALPTSASVTHETQPGWQVPAGAYEGEMDRCIDRELTARRLNEYGDPQGTLYAENAGPLGVTRSTRDRYRYVLQHHPEIGVACTRSPREPGW